MVELRDSEKGNRCFIIATGSSIKYQDLTILKEEIVISVSGLYMHKDINIINPKYHVLPNVFGDHKEITEEKKHVQWLNDMNINLPSSTIMIMSTKDKSYIEKYQLFKDRKIFLKNYTRYCETDDIFDIDINQMPNIWSISEGVIQTALFLGFKEIFLLGFDHDWFNGALVHFNGSEYLKFNNTDIKQEIVNIHGMDSEFQMMRHAKIFNKYKKLYSLKENIYNANYDQNTYVDTFPKVNYEKLFNNNYESELINSKKNFVKIKSQFMATHLTNILFQPHEKIAFSMLYNKNFNMLQELEGSNYVIYGHGTIGKTIYKLIEDKILAFVDQNSNLISKNIKKGEVYSPENLINMPYNKIIITVFGREDNITNYLVKDLNINTNKLIKLYSGT